MACELIRLNDYPRYIQGTIEMALKDANTIIQSDLESIAEEIIAVGCQKDGTLASTVELVVKLCAIDTRKKQSSRFIPCVKSALKGCYHRRKVIRHHHGNWMRLLKFTFAVYNAFLDTSNDTDLSDIMVEGLQSIVKECDEEGKDLDLRTILDPSEVDFLVFTLQDNGKNLEERQSEKMEELFNLIRSRIICEDTDTTIRQMLMEILEFRAFGWTLPEQVTNYYYGN